MSPTTPRRLRLELPDWLMVLFLGVCGALYILTSVSVERYGSDTTNYWGLARALVVEHRYWFNFEPHTSYPPGYPVFLSAVMLALGDWYRTVLIASLLTYLVGLACLYVYCMRHLSRWTSLAVCVLVGTSITFHYFATVGLHSEGVYFTTSILALLFFDVGNSTTDRRLRVVSIAMVAILASYLLLVRTIGVSLTAGLIMWMVWHYPDRGRPVLARWSPAVVVSLAALAMWFAWTGQQKADPANDDYRKSYVQQILKEDPHRIDSPRVTWRTLSTRTVGMVAVRAVNATKMVLNAPAMRRRYVYPAAALFVALIAIGFLKSIWNAASLADFYVLAYMGVLVVYPYDEGRRYLVPMHPFFVVYALSGFQAAAHAMRGLPGRASSQLELVTRWTGAGIKPVLFVAIVAAGLMGVAAQADDNLHADPNGFHNAPTVRLAKWVREHTEKGDVIMDDEPAILHRLTGRKTLWFPLSTDPGFLEGRVIANHVKYVVVRDEVEYEYYTPSTTRRFERLREARPSLFHPIFRFDGGTIYRVELPSFGDRGL